VAKRVTKTDDGVKYVVVKAKATTPEARRAAIERGTSGLKTSAKLPRGRNKFRLV
jgi:hypothetical protein